MDDRVTGIGGIFFKARDKARLLAWYRDHLGVDVQDWGGATFEWGKGHTILRNRSSGSSAGSWMLRATGSNCGSRPSPGRSDRLEVDHAPPVLA